MIAAPPSRIPASLPKESPFGIVSCAAPRQRADMRSTCQHIARSWTQSLLSYPQRSQASGRAQRAPEAISLLNNLLNIEELQSAGQSASMYLNFADISHHR